MPEPNDRCCWFAWKYRRFLKITGGRHSWLNIGTDSDTYDKVNRAIYCWKLPVYYLVLYPFISAKHVQALFKHLGRNIAPKWWGGYVLVQYQVIELVLIGATGHDGVIMCFWPRLRDWRTHQAILFEPLLDSGFQDCLISRELFRSNRFNNIFEPRAHWFNMPILLEIFKSPASGRRPVPSSLTFLYVRNL